MSKTYNSSNYLFSNFENKIGNTYTTKNSLNINEIYNLTTNNKIIEPLRGFSDLLKDILKTEKYNLFFDINPDLKDKIFKIIPYTYINNLNKFENRLFILTEEFLLLEINLSNLTVKSFNIKFKINPTVLIFNNCLYIYSIDDAFILISNNNNPTFVIPPINLKTIAKFNNNLLFSLSEKPFSVYVAEVENLIDIDTFNLPYNLIQLNQDDGYILKIINYKNNIYVIQQYGVSKLVISNGEYQIVSNCSIKSSIFDNTIELIDDYVIFLTSSGLYIFDGNDLKQIFDSTTNKFADTEHKSICFNNLYYLKTKMFIKNIATSVVIEFNIQTNSCNIYKINNISDIYLVKTINDYKLAISINDGNKCEVLFLDNHRFAVEKYIKFSKITFDDKPIKTLNDIKIQGFGNYTITITSDMQFFTDDICDSKHIKNIGLKGQIFEIEISSDSAFIVESLFFKISNIFEN